MVAVLNRQTVGADSSPHDRGEGANEANDGR